MLATSSGSEMPQHCFHRDQKYTSSPYSQAPAPILIRWMLLLLRKLALSWQGPGPGKGSVRQAFAPHEVCRHPTARWAWGDKQGRCWTNSLLGEGRRNREESDFCTHPALLWCHLTHVTSCSQGPQSHRDPAVREFSTGSKEGIPCIPKPSLQAFSCHYHVSTPLWAPLRPSLPAFLSSRGTLHAQKQRDCASFFPQAGTASGRGLEHPVPGSAGAIGGQQVSERGRGTAGTGREQVLMDKDQAGTGRSGRKQVLTGGELVSRAAADKEQPWIGREEATMRRKRAGMSKNK